MYSTNTIAFNDSICLSYYDVDPGSYYIITYMNRVF